MPTPVSAAASSVRDIPTSDGRSPGGAVLADDEGVSSMAVLKT
jgi:hypothetical protein